MEIADRYIDLGGLRFHYREVGDPSAPPVVLLDGLRRRQRGLAEVAARIPDCRLVTLGGGHGVHREGRDEFVAALRSFLGDDGDRRVG